MSLATPWACLTLQILVLSCTLCTYTETLTPLFSPGMMSTASSLSMVSTNWLIHSCLFAQIALSLNLWGTPEHNITLTLFNLQVQTLIRIQFSLNLSLPPPLMPVILPWYWTLWPPCEERCTSSKTGIADIECSNIWILKSILSVFSSHKSRFMNSFVFLCVHSFFWRSYPQSDTPQQSLITNFWPNAPVNIDAAYESKQSDNVLLFKGMCSLNLPKTPNLTLFSSAHY